MHKRGQPEETITSQLLFYLSVSLFLPCKANFNFANTNYLLLLLSAFLSPFLPIKSDSTQFTRFKLPSFGMKCYLYSRIKHKARWELYVTVILFFKMDMLGNLEVAWHVTGRGPHTFSMTKPFRKNGSVLAADPQASRPGLLTFAETAFFSSAASFPYSSYRLHTHPGSATLYLTWWFLIPLHSPFRIRGRLVFKDQIWGTK